MPRKVASRHAEIANTRQVGGRSTIFQAVDLHQGGRKVAIKIDPAKSDDIYRGSEAKNRTAALFKECVSRSWRSRGRV